MHDCEVMTYESILNQGTDFFNYELKSNDEL